MVLLFNSVLIGVKWDVKQICVCILGHMSLPLGGTLKLILQRTKHVYAVCDT